MVYKTSDDSASLYLSRFISFHTLLTSILESKVSEISKIYVSQTCHSLSQTLPHMVGKHLLSLAWRKSTHLLLAVLNIQIIQIRKTSPFRNDHTILHLIMPQGAMVMGFPLYLLHTFRMVPSTQSTPCEQRPPCLFWHLRPGKCTQLSKKQLIKNKFSPF